MKINDRIKEYRKKAGLTQEQVANSLGVSTPAVNKWERGVSYPDVTLLPPLARLLKIDLNTLLCFHEQMTESEIKQFSLELSKKIEEEGLDSGFSMAMKKIHEYPNCAKLISMTALNLEYALLLTGIPKAEKKIYQDQIIELYELIAKGDDPQLSERAFYTLASRYMNMGNYEKAQEMLDLFPERDAFDKGQLQAQLFIHQNQLDKAACLLERKLQMTLSNIQLILQYLSDIALKEGENQNASYIAGLAKESVRLFELWDYASYVVPLHVAVMQKDPQKSLALLDTLLSSVQNRWRYEETVLYHHIAQSEGELLEKSRELFPAFVKEKMLPPLLAEMEDGEDYAFLRDNPAFTALIAKYKKLVIPA